MQIGEITTTNSKGQIVIPRKIRKEFGITTGTIMKILPRGKSLYLLPIKGFITSDEGENSYVKILEKTAGAWGHVANAKKPIEIVASQKRKRKW